MWLVEGGHGFVNYESESIWSERDPHLHFKVETTSKVPIFIAQYSNLCNYGQFHEF